MDQKNTWMDGQFILRLVHSPRQQNNFQGCREVSGENGD